MALTREVIAAIGLAGQTINTMGRVVRLGGDLAGPCPSCNPLLKREVLSDKVFKVCNFLPSTNRITCCEVFFSNFYKPVALIL